jgi:hypothetical protein
LLLWVLDLLCLCYLQPLRILLQLFLNLFDDKLLLRSQIIGIKRFSLLWLLLLLFLRGFTTPPEAWHFCKIYIILY